MSIEDKIRKYHSLKSAVDIGTKELNKLNKEIKESLELGEHTIGSYKVIFSSRKQHDIDEEAALRTLGQDVWNRCTKTVLDKDLLESAYLREEITDDQMRKIRGNAKIISVLEIKRSDDVQG